MSARSTVLVTGASAGIGLATAVALARRGYSLRLVGRDPAKTEAALKAVRELDPSAVAFRADFSSLESVRGLAKELLARDEPLHVVIHNAGIWHHAHKRSKDGIEDTIAVNHLAPFLLTHLLLPRLRETEGDRRIVHVSSRLHAQAGETASASARMVHLANIAGLRVRSHGGRLDFDAFDDERSYRGIEAYARSKLAQIVFSCELARREQGITSNAVHPGSVATEVTRGNAVLARLNQLAAPFLKTPAEGAETSVYVATAPSLKGVTGRYFARSKEAPYASIADDRAVAERLWNWSAERVGL
ncbi:MAG: SDR family NAD(P)-dependent oxidoreductase [Deltaproteobacteria bacterium]|nr:SDR family NAD(P)-dependent oxidoreductase [Deltaproteobacteria bacterium]